MILRESETDDRLITCEGHEVKGRVSLTTRSREVEEKKGRFRVRVLWRGARGSNRLSLIYANVLLFCVFVMFRR